MATTVLITGASGGIGLALCGAFLRRGDTVLAQCFRNAGALKELRAQYPDRLRTIETDLRDPAAVKALADYALGFEPAVLVLNAGVSVTGLFQQVDEVEAADLFRVNVESMMQLTRAILPAMLRRHSGRILAVSSVWGRVGASCEVDYSASKAAVIGFCKALAKEVGPAGVTVNCIAPGFIDTPMNGRLRAEERQAVIDETPLCRAGTPGDVAALAVFLASDEASFLTGQVIGVDGGLGIT